MIMEDKTLPGIVHISEATPGIPEKFCGHSLRKGKGTKNKQEWETERKGREASGEHATSILY